MRSLHRSAVLRQALAALEALCGDRWRKAGLLLSQAAPEFAASGDATPRALAPIEQAWWLAEHLGAQSDATYGRHATPRTVALELAHRVRDHGQPAAWIDPACGVGALLLAAAEVEIGRGRCDFDRFHGHDVDPVAIALAQAVLWVAAGQPERPVGNWRVADFTSNGVDFGAVLANPPWGLKLGSASIDAWKRRVGPNVAALLAGEINSYTLFLLDVVLRSDALAGFVTPIHWLHRRSLDAMRAALAASNRLREVWVLRKRVFRDAPDMIPALTIWAAPSAARIRVHRTGFGAPLDGPRLPIESVVDVPAEDWRTLPYAVLPLLRTQMFARAGQRLLTTAPRLSDPELPRHERLFHLGDGAYKSRVMPHVEAGGVLPLLVRASEIGRYRIDAPQAALNEAGVAALSAGERERFAKPKLVLHALKKANAPWRLSAALDDGRSGPLALTNNFMLLVPERYDGDLHYPLALLNSRLFNRIYTEHFPGVNIEAYAVGLLHVPWPPRDDPAAPPEGRSDLHEWAGERARLAGGLSSAVYELLCELAARAMATTPVSDAMDAAIEALVAGLFRIDRAELATLMGGRGSGSLAGC